MCLGLESVDKTGRVTGKDETKAGKQMGSNEEKKLVPYKFEIEKMKRTGNIFYNRMKALCKHADARNAKFHMDTIL